MFHLGGWCQTNTYFRFQKIEGLSQNTVFKIFQDKHGFIWAGTGDGLNRYDGRGFKIYKPGATASQGFIHGRIIRGNMFEDESNRIWLCTESGLQYLDKKADRFYTLPPMHDTLQLMNGSLFPIHQLNQQAWFGKTSAGILAFHLQTNKYEYYPFPGIKNNPLKYLGEKAVFDQQGNIWITQQAGLFSFNVHTKKWSSYLENMPLSHFCLVNETLYIVAAGGIILFDVKTHAYKLLKTNSPFNQVRCITYDRHMDVFAGDASGNIIKLTRKDSLVRTIGNINKSNNATLPVYDLFFDQTGILWIGTDGMGLLKASISPPDFYKYPENETGPGIFIKSIYEDDKGIIWLGTFGQGILQLNTNTNEVTPLNAWPFQTTGSTVKLVSFIKEDQYKNLWIGYGDQLYCRKFNTTSFTSIPIPFKGSINTGRLRVTELVNDKERWLLSTTLGAFELSIAEDAGKSRLAAYPLLGDFSFMFAQGNNDYIFGYNEGGLGLFNNEDNQWRFKKYLVKKLGFKCVYHDSVNNRVWFGTDRGLMVYNPQANKYHLYTEADGLGNGYVYGILEWAGELWLSTNGGLCNVKIIEGRSNEFPAIRCRNYKQKDGLQADEFNTGAFLKGRDGKMYFGGINGINWLMPNHISPIKKIDRLVVTQLSVNKLAPDSTISSLYIHNLDLEHTQNNIYLQFHALEFSNPGNIHYSYKLSGWDKDWINSETNNEVRYNNLPSGNYVFNIRATNDSSSWMNTPYTIHINIQPPFWKRWWFYLLAFLTMVALIIWITKVMAQWKLKKEIEKLERQNALFAERMRIAQEMHDDIGAGLTQISLISESAKLHTIGSNGIKNELDDISSTSRQLVDNIGEIIWSLNPQHNTLEVLLVHLREQLNKLVEYAVINCSIHFPANIPMILVNNQQRRNILLVAKEIVHNAVKHSQGKNLSITVLVQNGQLVFTIRDDGIGFDTTVAKKGNGLKNIRQRISETGGCLELTSTPGCGTLLEYYFPLK